MLTEVGGEIGLVRRVASCLEGCAMKPWVPRTIRANNITRNECILRRLEGRKGGSRRDFVGDQARGGGNVVK